MRYLVVTEAGVIGRGNTPAAAAKQAGIQRSYVSLIVCEAVEGLVEGAIFVDAFGNPRWQMTSECEAACQFSPMMGDFVIPSVFIFRGRARVNGSRLETKGEM